MRDDIKGKFDSIFRKHGETQAAAQKARQAKETKEANFLREFLTVCEDIIRPAMTEVGDYVRNHVGCDYQISVTEDTPAQGRDRGSDASIKITFNVKGPPDAGYSNQFPYLSVRCQKHLQRVMYHESTMAPGRGGHAGACGEAELNEVTPDVVQEKILSVAAEVFK